MNSTQEEELDSLQAIFCKQDEITTRKDTESVLVTINLCVSSSPGEGNSSHIDDLFNTSVDFILASDYPFSHTPGISIRCLFLPSCKVKAVLEQVQERGASLIGQPMLLDLFSLAQDLLHQEINISNTSVHKPYDRDTVLNSQETTFVKKSSAQNSSSRELILKTLNIKPVCGPEHNNPEDKLTKNVSCELKDLPQMLKEKHQGKQKQNFDRIESDLNVITTLLQLDHMRSKNNYIKLIKKWTEELGLTGRLIFCKKLILILLQGTPQSIKEYIVRNRTMNVDIDSKGRACKERMLTVLCEVSGNGHQRLQEFSVLEISRADSLQDFFQSSAMKDIYNEYVVPLCGTKNSRVQSQS